MARGGRRRGLSEEDRRIWDEAMRSATPLRAPSHRAPGPDGEARDGAAPPRDPIGDPLRKPPAKPHIRPKLASADPGTILRPHGRAEPAISHYFAPPDRPERARAPTPGIDRRTAERLRKGERTPEARIDLHGMTADRAHRALHRFIDSSSAQGLRCVLVITGKGSARDEGDLRGVPFGGVLRSDAPRWLATPPLAGRIVGVFEAHQRHGGAGALYVYLKRRR